MKFLHVSDLHIGKCVCGVSMLGGGDQAYWIDRFLELCDSEKPDAVLIAGDLYDRALPSGDAVETVNRLLTELSSRDLCVFLIAGNHDSPERISYADAFLAKSNVYAAGTLTEKLTKVTLSDACGPVNVYLLPYVFPERVRALLKDDGITDYDSAVRAILARQDIDTSQRNVLVAHQNVITPGKTEIFGGSESVIGGVGEVRADAFDAFDYVALGHIHAAYPVGRESVRYAGSPLCYHFDETKQAKKGPVCVTLGPKGTEPDIRTILIPPLHPMRIVRGSYEEVRKDLVRADHRGEYLSVEITDQIITSMIYNDIVSIAGSHESVLMKIHSDYEAFSEDAGSLKEEDAASSTPEQLFAMFYRARSGGAEPDDNELAVIKKAGEIVRNSGGTLGDDDVAALLSFAEELK